VVCLARVARQRVLEVVFMHIWLLSLFGFIVGGLIAYALYKNIKGNW